MRVQARFVLGVDQASGASVMITLPFRLFSSRINFSSSFQNPQSTIHNPQSTVTIRYSIVDHWVRRIIITSTNDGINTIIINLAA